MPKKQGEPRREVAPEALKEAAIKLYRIDGTTCITRCHAVTYDFGFDTYYPTSVARVILFSYESLMETMAENVV